MSDTPTSFVRPDHGPDSLAAFCGWLAIACVIVMAVAVAVGDFVVPGNDMMADTISEMAAGNMSWIVDTGIIAYSIGLGALALGSAARHPGGLRWSVGSAGLIALGVLVFLIGFRNEYGDGDEDRADEFHMTFVYCLGVLFAVVPWIMSRAAGRIRKGYAVAMRWSAGLWAVTAPWFFFMPDGYDGIYERGLGLISFLFVLSLARLLIHEAPGARVGAHR